MPKLEATEVIVERAAQRRLVGDADKALRQLMRDAILNSDEGLWLLIRDVLFHPNKKCDNDTGPGGCCEKSANFYEPLHKKWAQWAQDTRSKKKGILAPRGHFKSSVISFGKCVWSILKNPNIRILIVSQKLANAVGFCGQSKKALQDNERMRWLFPEFCVEAGKQFGNQQEFTVPNRTDISLVAPTIYSVHLGAAMASQHYDLIIADDPISDDDVTTEDQAQKSYSNFGRMVPLLDPGGQIIVVGTRYSHMDLFSTLVPTELGGNAASTPYEWIVRSVLENADGKPDFDAGVPIFPTRFTAEVIASTLEACILNPTQGETYFWNQYMNQCRAPGMQPFLAEWFVEIEPERVPPLFGTIITTDTALKDDAKRIGGDFTVVGPGGWDVSGRLYLLPDGVRSNRMRSKEFLDIIVTWMRKYNTPFVAKQKVSEDTLGTSIKDAATNAMLPIIYKPLVVAGMGNKQVRIKDALQAPMQRREVIWVQRRLTDGTLAPHPLLEITRKELVNLGQFPTDDAGDWLANFYHPDVRVSRQNIVGQQRWVVPNAPRQISSDPASRWHSVPKRVNLASGLMAEWLRD
jgi:hypothetical protein